jgi:hypothetical protein
MIDLTQHDDTELDDSEVKSLAALLADLAAAEKEVTQLEAKLKAAKDHAFKLTSDIIPSRMDELGVPFIGLPDGRKIEVVDMVTAKIPKGRQAEAYQWLRENGAESLIKNVVTATFSRGEDSKAADLLAALEAQGLAASQDESVHWQTLRAYVREQREKGVQLPEDLFGIYEYRMTKVS